MLTLNEQEEKAIDKIIAAIADCISLESVRTIPIPTSGMSFSGLEIIQSRRQVLHDGEEVKLTHLEYSTLVFLASNPGIVLTQEQIFEAVWNMDSDSCHSSVQVRCGIILDCRQGRVARLKPDPSGSQPDRERQNFLHFFYFFISHEQRARAPSM
ncbi:MAG: winged helix-turn-helix domain-containing protein [Lachnospiraceae bacterium]|nr:winged helix-turn-helix domain-containing protein [Lachnospiraceae bacterium]